jgi:chromosome segregation ATPase
MENKKSLVPAQKLDTVSPATRLLDKRRKMYENQEAFIAKKKHFTQQEFEFQTREGQLREEDHKLQQSLIQYATFLDNNAKVMRNCDQNIAKLREENEQRAREIDRKKKQLDILESKKKRIEQ